MTPKNIDLDVVARHSYLCHSRSYWEARSAHHKDTDAIDTPAARRSACTITYNWDPYDLDTFHHDYNCDWQWYMLDTLPRPWEVVEMRKSMGPRFDTLTLTRILTIDKNYNRWLVYRPMPIYEELNANPYYSEILRAYDKPTRTHRRHT